MSKEIKLTEEELKELKEAKLTLDKFKLAIGDLELQKKSLYEQVSTLQSEFRNMEDKLIQKYGKDSIINMNTGTVKQHQDVKD
jgi:predicted  nucleic acid-binding Zn-ribbon protein|tara:strand:- start:9879 stop:10127 length:249 start_codon:yes stop_codon:yes gene_type:complete